MQSKTIIHPWIDDTFFEQGSFIVTDHGKSVLLLKGGILSRDEGSFSQDGPTIYCKTFHDNNYHYHHSHQYLKINLEDLRARISPSESMPAIKKIKNYDDIFSEDFRELKNIMPEEVKKAVLVSREEYIASDPRNLRKHLFAKAIDMKKGRAYGFWGHEFGIIGCTPETLFEMDKGLVTTEALAGTAKLGEEVELLNSLKDRNEHEFVIQDISEKLFSLGLQAKVGPTVTSQFSTMIHLRTKLSAESPHKISAQRLGEVLSPTAALGGYPQKKAKDFLLGTRYQKMFPKRIFGSVIATESEEPVGLVMIRNVQWEGETFYIESGVGVVEESDLNKELDELNLKRSVVRNHYL